MKVLELFAGSRSFSKAAEERGHETFSVDWEPYGRIDLVKDIRDMTIDDVPWVPDVIWASPDCTTYSIAAISTHRTGTEPKSDYAKLSDEVNQHFISLIKQWQELNPDLIYFIENPRGMLRKMPFMQEFNRETVWYCFAGETKVITDKGSFDLKSLSGTEPILLMPDGSWKQCPIRYYGKQQLYELTLKRRNTYYDIYVTGNHLWFIEDDRDYLLRTKDLEYLDRIPTVYPKDETSVDSYDWFVISVKETNRYEGVYCAEVEGYEAFVLDGNILTHNCKYGDVRAKPTDIWTNSSVWEPRPVCRNGNPDCHHQRAPRGSKTGTQGKKNAYERSRIPQELCDEVLEAAEKEIKLTKQK